ncbi:MAG: glycosyltransferase family 4 protein, partial [Bacteroidota bacterium]
LSKHGNDITVFNAVVKKTAIDNKYQSIMNDKSVIHRECFNRHDRFFYHYKQNKIYRELIHSCDISGYDLIHSHNLFNGGYVAYKINDVFEIPYVVSVRNTDINTFLKVPTFKALANNIVKNAAGVIFLSTPYKDIFINKYVKPDIRKCIEEKSSVIYNGLEEFWLKNPGKAKQLKDKKSINFLCVGKVDKNKNITTAIKAMDILISKGYKAKLTVIGQILDKGVLKDIKEHAFCEIIEYLKKEDLIDFYCKSDIYIMPSIHESFGRVYAEAMTQGLPVIYSKGQGFDGLFVDGEIGYAVPSRNPSYISECIEKIIQNYDAISRRCIEKSKQFNWDIISEKLHSFYIQKYY